MSEEEERENNEDAPRKIKTRWENQKISGVATIDITWRYLHFTYCANPVLLHNIEKTKLLRYQRRQFRYIQMLFRRIFCGRHTEPVIEQQVVLLMKRQDVLKCLLNIEGRDAQRW